MPNYHPSESELDTYGGMIAATLFGLSVLGGALLALQIAMAFYSLSAFLKSSNANRKGRLRFIVVGFLLLCTSSIDTCLDIWQNFRILLNGGPTGISYFKVGPRILNSNKTVDLVGNIMLGITVTAGDVLMLWRCFMIWSNKKRVIFLPAFACMGSVVLYWLFLIWTNAENVGPEMAVRTGKILVASISLSVAMNITVTALILLRLALTWRRTSKSLPDRKLPRMYLDITAIIVESAAPVAFFGICWIVSKAVLTVNPPSSFAEMTRVQVFNRFSNWLYYLFCAISPQMIILRVTTGKLWKDAAESGRERAAFSQPLRFAHSASESRESSSTSNV